MSSIDYDGLHLCAGCGDAYTTGKYCRSCAEQIAIDNDPMAGYDALHYDPVFGYDNDDEDYGEEYIDMWQDMPYDEEYLDGFLDMYDEDDTVELTLRGRAVLRLWSMRSWLSDRLFSIELAGGLRSYLQWRMFWFKRNLWHKWRMRFDASYRKTYDDIPF